MTPQVVIDQHIDVSLGKPSFCPGWILASCPHVAQQEKRFVYVLRSSVDQSRHYVGLTADVAERVAAHNAGQSVHTASMKPWTLVVSVEFHAERIARRFEHYLKSGSGRAFAKRHFAEAIDAAGRHHTARTAANEPVETR